MTRGSLLNKVYFEFYIKIKITLQILILNYEFLIFITKDAPVSKNNV